MAPSAAAILRTSRFLPLKAKAEVRATTRSVGICASQFDNSSVKPSHSACSDWSTLMSTSGSTTIVGSASTTASAWKSLPGMFQATTANTSAARMLPNPSGHALDRRAPVRRPAPDDRAGLK